MSRAKNKEYNRKYKLLHEDRVKESGKKYYLKNKDTLNAYNRKNYLKNEGRRKEYYLKNKDKIKEKDRKRYLKNKDKQKVRNLKKLYDITIEQFEQMKIAQDNRCAICNNPFKNSKDTCIDHDHITGKIRQLLCRKCNWLLGMCCEDFRILQNAINYLNKWNVVL